MKTQFSFVEMSASALEKLCNEVEQYILELNAKLDKDVEDSYLKTWNTPKWYHRLFKITPKVYIKEDFIKWVKERTQWWKPPYYPHGAGYGVLDIIKSLRTAIKYCRYQGPPGEKSFVYVSTDHLDLLNSWNIKK